MRVLPADVYDTLQLTAIAYGGIGSRWLNYPPGEEDSAPFCIYGMSAFVTDSYDAFENHVARALDRVFEGESPSWKSNGASVNNEAVEAINARKGADSISRVSWEEWCAELGVVRGDS